MPRKLTDEAIVLKSYNVGEADRFLLLFTRHSGRITARAHGVRRVSSRRAAGLLPLHRINAEYEAHSFGHVITGAECISSHATILRDPGAFSAACEAMELLLALTEEGEPMPEIYALTSDFLSVCSAGNADILPAVFTLRLLSILGSLPSVTHSVLSHLLLKPGDDIVYSRHAGGLCAQHEDPGGMRLSPQCLLILRGLGKTSFHESVHDAATAKAEILRFTHGVLGHQSGLTLKAPGVSFAISSSVTPTCQ